MIELRTAIASYPHVLALKNGIVGSGRLRLGHEEVEPITRAFRRMVRTMDFDVCEIALTTLAQARDYGKPLTALPVVLMRGFHHAALVCPVGSRLRGPADLLGKRIGVRAFSQTTGVWVRGILLEEYGVITATSHGSPQTGHRRGRACPGISRSAERGPHRARPGPVDDAAVGRDRRRGGAHSG
jgi:4,5-dihydroxyphthalate decarboxylase